MSKRVYHVYDPVDMPAGIAPLEAKVTIEDNLIGNHAQQIYHEKACIGEIFYVKPRHIMTEDEYRAELDKENDLSAELRLFEEQGFLEQATHQLWTCPHCGIKILVNADTLPSDGILNCPACKTKITQP